MAVEEKKREAGGLGDELVAAAEEPLTLKDRVVGALISLVMLVLAAGMFVRPALLPSDASQGVSGRRTSGLLSLVDLVWSRPVGVMLILLGLLVLYGSLTKKGAPKAAA